MSKTLNIDLGGQQRTLLFGTIGFYDHIEKATGEDPFTWIRKFDELIAKVQKKEKIEFADYKDMVVLIYAGLNSHLDATDQANIEFDKVRKWSNGVDETMLGNVFYTAISALSKGEAVAPKINGAKAEEGLVGVNSGQ